jgi:hypothetical protein
MKQAVLNRARNDKFWLILDLPKALKDYTDPTLQEKFSADTIQYTCYGSPVPSFEVKSIPVPFSGQSHQISSISRAAYPSLPINFLLDNGWKNYWVLLKWINMFNDTRTSISEVGFKEKEETFNNIENKAPYTMKELVSKFTTIALDEYNNPIMQFGYVHVFPTSLSEIKFDNRNAEEISCVANFAFNQVRPEMIKNVDDNNC